MPHIAYAGAPLLKEGKYEVMKCPATRGRPKKRKIADVDSLPQTRRKYKTYGGPWRAFVHSKIGKR
eukprot:666456-Amphidinium_carterae.1